MSRNLKTAGAIAAGLGAPLSPGSPPAPARAEPGPVGGGAKAAKTRRFELLVTDDERRLFASVTARADVAIRGEGSLDGVRVSTAEVVRALVTELAEHEDLQQRIYRRIVGQRGAS
jgi:hypothetical protein